MEDAIDFDIKLLEKIDGQGRTYYTIGFDNGDFIKDNSFRTEILTRCLTDAKIDEGIYLNLGENRGCVSLLGSQVADLGNTAWYYTFQNTISSAVKNQIQFEYADSLQGIGEFVGSPIVNIRNGEVRFEVDIQTTTNSKEKLVLFLNSGNK